MDFRIEKVTNSDEEGKKEILRFLRANFPSAYMWDSAYINFRLRRVNRERRGFFVVAYIGDKVIGCLSVAYKLIRADRELIVGELGDAYVIQTKAKLSKLVGEVKLWDGLEISYVEKNAFGRLALAAFKEVRDDNVDILVGYPNEIAQRSWVRRLGLVRNGDLEQTYIAISSLRRIMQIIVDRVSRNKPHVYYQTEDSYNTFRLDCMGCKGKMQPGGCCTFVMTYGSESRFLVLVYLLRLFLAREVKRIILPIDVAERIGLKKYLKDVRLKAVVRQSDVELCKIVKQTGNTWMLCDTY